MSEEEKNQNNDEEEMKGLMQGDNNEDQPPNTRKAKSLGCCNRGIMLIIVTISFVIFEMA